MTDNEKRAHDLAITALPYAMNASDWKFYVFDSNDHGALNPDVAELYKELYDSFLDQLVSLF